VLPACASDRATDHRPYANIPVQIIPIVKRDDVECAIFVEPLY
jgi:hypothetical protein